MRPVIYLRRDGRNAILAALPESEMALISTDLSLVDLASGDVIQERDHLVEYLWFPRRGVCSVLASMEQGERVEVATVGPEGMIGLPPILGVRHSAQLVVSQVPGQADRLPVSVFLDLRARLPTLNGLLLRYIISLLSQVAQSSACNRLHPIEARCARWLLQTHDRVEGDRFSLTHEFLAQMLGVTRPSVTIAAGLLQNAGLIQYTRGVIEIRDRQRLEEAACECYKTITEEFQRLFDIQPDGA